jgi:hypothetical protein
MLVVGRSFIRQESVLRHRDDPPIATQVDGTDTLRFILRFPNQE